MDNRDITNNNTNKRKNMIQMNFADASGKTSFTICPKNFARTFEWQMNDRGFIWVSTDIL
jgi:hypothetical protein